MAVPSDLIFECGELVYTDGAAGVHFSGGDADFSAKAKFTAIGKLSGGVVKHDGAVEFIQKAICCCLVLCDD